MPQSGSANGIARFPLPLTFYILSLTIEGVFVLWSQAADTGEHNRMSDPLTPEAIRGHLAAKWMGGSCTASTRSIPPTSARELARAGAVDGTVVSAESQSQGRGRLGRSWVSPAYKNLYLSVILRPDLPVDRLPQIGLMAGVAACDTVREWHPATLKWPNDVLIGGRKVAGILAETEGRGRPDRDPGHWGKRQRGDGRLS